MYKTANGDEIFVVDTHVHYWDGRPENFVNVHGEQFIDCFYGYHKALSPPDRVWPQEKFRRYSIEDMHRDLFEEGYVDVAVFQPTYLKEFYKEGFNTTEQNAVLKEKYPQKFILNGSFDPRDGARGLDGLRALHEKYKIRGVKLYTAEWKGDSRGWKLTDPSAERYLAECQM